MNKEALLAAALLGGSGGGGGSVVANQAFPESWPTGSSTTTAQFCAAVNADATAVQGGSYLGEVTWSDLPTGVGNAEIIVQIMDGTGTSGKVIHLICTSGNVAPYRWEYTYWNDGASVSGWIGFQPALPDPSAASVGDVLTKGQNGIEWSAPRGYTVTESTQDVDVIFEQSFTGESMEGVYVGNVVADWVETNSLSVSFDGSTYTCPRQVTAMGNMYGGTFDGTTFDFSAYPFIVLEATRGTGSVVVESSGSHSISATTEVTVKVVEPDVDFVTAVEKSVDNYWEANLILHLEQGAFVESLSYIIEHTPVDEYGSPDFGKLYVMIKDVGTGDGIPCKVLTWAFGAGGTIREITFVTDCFYPAYKWKLVKESNQSTLSATLLNGYNPVVPMTYKLDSNHDTTTTEYDSPVLFQINPTSAST